MRIRAFILSLCLLASAACSEKEQEGGAAVREVNMIPVELAFALQNEAEDQTKANVSYLTELSNTGSFRGMDNICVIPFTRHGAVEADDVAITSPRPLPSIMGTWDAAAYSNSVYHSGLIRNNKAHFYPAASSALPESTASVLVYGTAPRTSAASGDEKKRQEGSLIVTGLDESMSAASASSITFAPDPIYSGGIPGDADAMAKILTDIIAECSFTQAYFYLRNNVWTAGYVAVRWDDETAEPLLKEYFKWVTGDGAVMSASGASTEYMLTQLYQRLLRYTVEDDTQYMHNINGKQFPAYQTMGTETPLLYEDLYNKLCETILRHFYDQQDAGKIKISGDKVVSFVSLSQKNYPSSLGLPEGSAVMRWTGTKYQPVMQGLDGIAPIDRFCFMPSLYYFSNSTLSTASDRDIQKKFTQDVESWNTLLNQYRQGKVVNKRTHSVAFDEPLQYSCGMLVATVSANSTALEDNDDNPRTYCSATGTNFPVTGIIIGSQYGQTFCFDPDTNTSEYSIYDNRISNVYLTHVKSADFRTLVLPTPPGRDIYICLELRNDSGEAFTGAEGIIQPGGYFYLTGKLEHSTDASIPSVFMRDSYTQAHFSVPSFRFAHIAIPELGRAQLVLGVNTSLNWTMSAASYVTLD